MRKLSFNLLLIGLILSTSCNNDEFEKEIMLAGKWKLDNVTLNNNDYYYYSVYLLGSTYHFFDDYTIDFTTPQSQEKETGTWKLKDNSSELVIVFSGLKYTYSIEKINSSELWLSFLVEEGKIRLKYISSE